MASILGQRFPMVTLKNKLTVVNYGSNHSYKFDTGEELDKCTDTVCHDTELISKHTGLAKVIVDINREKFTVTIPDDKLDNWRDHVVHVFPEYKDCKMWLDVFINYQVSDRIQDDILTIAEMDIIDVILVPYPLLDAWSLETRMQREIAENTIDLNLDDYSDTWEYALKKMRTCKLEDRVTKVIYSDRFCASEEVKVVDLKRSSLLAEVE